MNPSYLPQPVPFVGANNQPSLQLVLSRKKNFERHPSETGLMLPFNQSRRWVALSQIVRLEGVGNYTTCYFFDAPPLLVALSLKVLADRLPHGSLVRPHRKHLLNPQYIEAISSAQLVVLLTTGERITVARRRVTAFRKAWKSNSSV